MLEHWKKEKQMVHGWSIEIDSNFFKQLYTIDIHCKSINK